MRSVVAGHAAGARVQFTWNVVERFDFARLTPARITFIGHFLLSSPLDSVRSAP